MSLLPGVAALALGAAAIVQALALAARRASLEIAVRIVAGLGALALLPVLADAGGRGLAILGLIAALRPGAVSCLAASASALVLSLRPAPAQAETAMALMLAGAATGVAVAALDSSIVARLARGGDPSFVAAAFGAALCGVLVAVDHGRVLRWSYALDGEGPRLELPGAGLLLGLTLLVSLAGTLLVAARALAGTQRLAAAAGRRLLLLACGLAALGAGLILFEGLARSEAALAASAGEVAALGLATGGLIFGVLVMLGERPAREFARIALRAESETYVAAVLALLVLGAAGLEGWLRAGSYGTPEVARASAAALLGLGAAQPTGLGVLRRAAFAAGLLSLLLRAA